MEERPLRYGLNRKRIMKDTIALSTTASVEQVFQIITDLEMIKKWELSHNLPLVRHEWIPDTGTVKEGNILRIITPFWRFEARCTGVQEYEVRWEFIKGPLKGMEFWRAEPSIEGCQIIKYLEYEIPALSDRLLWHFGGRWIHNRASRRQLEGIKYLAQEGDL